MLPPYTITRRQGASSCYATTVQHNKTTEGFIMLCYHCTSQQDDKVLHHAMLPPYTIARRKVASSWYATTVHHNKTRRDSSCYATIVHHSKTTRGIIMLCLNRTPQEDDKGLHHAMLQPYTITRRQGASSCYATTVHHSKTTKGILMLCYHRTP